MQDVNYDVTREYKGKGPGDATGGAGVDNAPITRGTALIARLLVAFVLVCCAVALGNMAGSGELCNAWCAGPPSEVAFVQCIESCQEVLP